MFVRLLLFSLAVICIVMGFHYVKREFGISPGLPDLTLFFDTALPSAPPAAAPPASTQSGALDPSKSDDSMVGDDRLGSLFAVPVLLDETGIAASSVTLAYIRETQPLMVVLFGTDVPATAAASAIAQLRTGAKPPIIAVDHEGGLVQRLSGEGFTRLPSWQQLCNMSELQRAPLLASSAAQLKQVGINAVLGPVMDLSASGSALRSRTCAANPDQVVLMARESIEAYRAEGVSSILKHYPGIGSAKVDLHTASAKVVLTPKDTQPFEALLLEQPELPIMISHVRVEPADALTPCSMSFVCVGELHRVFPKALLISDALEMKSAGYLASSSAVLRPLPDRATNALRAGIDVLLFGPAVTEADLRAVHQKLQQEYVLSSGLTAKAAEHVARNEAWRSSLLQ